MRIHRTVAVVTGVIIAAATHAVQAQTVPAGYEAEAVVTGLSQPTTMAFLGPDELFVLEKVTGRVRHVDLTTNPPTITTALTLAVDGDFEKGLLGIALHPNWPDLARVFLYYTKPGGHPVTGHRIERYTWNGTSLVNPVIIQEIPAGGAGNHNGGIILFGPDAKLYAIIGDLNRNEKTQNYESSPTLTRTSVIFRWNIGGATPNDNPFDTAGWEEFYAYGIRNSFGMTFDPLTGDLWDTENGPNTYDEVNRIVPGGNSGWEDIMGPDSRDPQDVDDLLMIENATYVDPAFSWFNTEAPTGIVFIDSCRWEHDIRYDCFVATNNNGKLYHFKPNAERTGFALTGGLADLVFDPGDNISEINWGFSFGNPTDLEIGPDGYLYVVGIGTGIIYRVRPEHPMGDINQNGIVGNADRTQFINLLLTREEEPDPPEDDVAQGDFDGNGVVDGDDIPCFVESFFMDD